METLTNLSVLSLQTVLLLLLLCSLSKDISVISCWLSVYSSVILCDRKQAEGESCEKKEKGRESLNETV